MLLATALLALALALRAPGLRARPMHIDEAVQAVKTGELLEHGKYRYDPQEYHGPLLYYAGAAALRARGITRLAEASEAALRAVPLAAGLLVVVALLGCAPLLGRGAAAAAAALAACSPSLVFYSTYYIQEMLLVAAWAVLLAALAAGVTQPRRRWLALAGAALGAMIASKETWVLPLGALLLGAALALCSTGAAARPRRPGAASVCRVALWLLLPALLVAGVFYTSWGRHPRGLLDALTAWTHYAGRAGGQGSAGNHAHPWFQYLLWYGWWRRPGLFIGEWPVWLGAAAGVVLLLRQPVAATGQTPARRDVARATLGWLALLLPVLLSAIPYKTPWVFLPAQLVLVLAAGVGWAGAWQLAARRRGLRWLVSLLAVLGLLHLAGQARAVGGRYAADPRNPFAYAQAGHDVERLARRMEQLAASAAAGRGQVVQVVAPEYWPLPWYLRAWPRVGWRQGWPGTLPPAALWLLDPALAEAHAASLPEGAISELYALRPGVFITLVVPAGAWQRMLDSESKP